MLKNFLICVLLINCLFSCRNAEKKQTIPESKASEFSEFPFKKGINMSHWLSQTTARGEERKQVMIENDFGFLAFLGYDHIRLPIDEEQLFFENGEKDPEAWILVHNAINWCKKYNLRIILDLHIIRSHDFLKENNPLFTSKEALEDFVNIWRKISEEFSRYPKDLVAYELLNEAVAEDPADWNNVIAYAVKEIRKLEPERKLIIGSNQWQSVNTFNDLAIPDDANLILSFHFYKPHPFTHYRAHWDKLANYSGPVKYPGEVVSKADFNAQPEELKKVLEEHMGNYNADTLEYEVLKAVKVAKEHNLPLYCGEFGALPTVDREQRLQWYTDVVSIFDKHNIAWANWDFKGGFAIFNFQTGYPDCELIKALLGNCALEE
ncbi:MAG: cellulase family glycosylhydrolase [Bacteroidales bacterium]|nr:cellulase family glycosylhydrolase [Bacteroidales bacterium]MBN2817628.1 cellulase family glycosylhydrolase [Bacteroidales bacterium]